MRKSIVLSKFLAACLALGAATATADDFKGFYAGLGIGSTAIDESGFEQNGIDDSDTSFKVFAGYSFGELLGLELTYLDGGTVGKSDVFSTDVFSTSEVETRIINLSVIGTLPLTDSFSLFGKLGYASIDTDTKNVFSFGALGADSFSDSKRDEEISYGAGAVYSFGRSFQLRAEYEGFDVSGGKLNSVSLSGIFRFR